MKSAVTLLLSLVVAVPSFAAELGVAPRKAACAKVDLLDQNGLPIPGQQVAGLLVGGKPIIPEADYPRYSALRVGAPADCPGALVESVVQSYKESCLTGERRGETAKTNNVTRESVEKQCQTIQQSLGESLTAYLK